MSGAYESPATRIEIRGTPAVEFGKFLKLFTNPPSYIMWLENYGIDEEYNKLHSECSK
jgi:hypothetical protein